MREYHWVVARTYRVAVNWLVLLLVGCLQHDEVSNYPDLDDMKKPSTVNGTRFFHGGERGIRTLVGVLAQTRFPVVRLRPAQPSLHATYI